MRRAFVFTLLCSFAACAAAAAPATVDPARLARGRYLVTVAGCNDCHTPGFAQSGGHVPESHWLTGDGLGFAGPWGTTYPTNLRRRLSSMDVDAFTRYAHALRTRPPMPYWALNAMSDEDLAALHAFVVSLGLAGDEAPAALAPGVAAGGPVVRFPAPAPAASPR